MSWMSQQTTMIKFNDKACKDFDLSHIIDCINSGKTSGSHKYTKLCEQWLKDYFINSESILTTSCTHALELAAILLDIGTGDEVIMPSFTFVSTANAFVLRGAKPVFCDIDPNTLNIDACKIEQLITKRTKAIVPVHYAGIGCDMDAILSIAKKHNLFVIEDNAHGFLGARNQTKLGQFGTLSTLSFHETKNISCGEGGALIINDKSLKSRAEIIRDKGTNRSQFLSGVVDKYTWTDVGSSYVLSDILAAVLYTEFVNSSVIQAQRKLIWQTYHEKLKDWALSNEVKTPFVSVSDSPSWHIYFLIFNSEKNKFRFLEHMKTFGIECTSHYVPLHSSPFGSKIGATPQPMLYTDLISSCIVRLPLYHTLTVDHANHIIDCICKFR